MTRYYKKLKEYSLIIVALLIAWFSRYPAREVDPTAAVVDAGAFQIPLIGIYKFCILVSFAWIALRVLWPDVTDYFKNEFKHDYYFNLTPWEKLRSSLLLFLAFLSSLVLLSIF